MLRFHIVTLFPESIEPYLQSSILGRAQESKKIKVDFYNPKDFISKNKKRVQDERVDRRPYGGGPGMVLRPEPILRAVEAALKKNHRVQGGTLNTKPEVLFFATDGKVFDEAMAKKLARPTSLTSGTHKSDLWVRTRDTHIILICGHYEGVDARVQKILKAKKVSVGPYVLTGGELPAATIIDAVARHVPGVLGKAESLEASRVSSPEVYTRPEVLEWKKKKYRVPKVLLTGNHAKINEWKSSRRK